MCLVVAQSAQAASGDFERAWGKSVNGGGEFGICTIAASCQYGYTGGLGGEMNWPGGIAVDTAGHVYVADANNNRIQRFDSDGNFERAWGKDVGGSGVNLCTSAATCQAGAVGALGGEMSAPYGVAVDAAGKVYVADTQNHRIQKFDSDGNFARSWGNGVNGGPGFEACTVAANCQAGFAGTLGGEMYVPQGVAASPGGKVYVADTANSRVQRFDSDGHFERTWGSGVNGGNGPELCTVASSCTSGQRADRGGELYRPYGVATGAAAKVYVADTDNNRIQRFDSDGNFERAWGKNVGGSGVGLCTVAASCTGGGTGALGGQMNSPTGVAADAGGMVYLADYANNRIQQFDSDGAFVRAWGKNVGGSGVNLCTQSVSCQAGSGLGGEGGTMSAPYGIAVNAAGKVYLTEQGNHRIQRFGSDADTTPPDTQITGGPAQGSTASDNDPSFTFGGSPASDTSYFECKLDNGSFATCTSPKNYTDLADASHTFSVRACDAAVNCDQSPATRTWTIDAGGGPRTLLVSKTGGGSGTVSSIPAGINCGIDCAENYAGGTLVTLFATPAPNSNFTGWSGVPGCSTTGPCQITMDQARNLTANFELIQRTLTVNKGGTGAAVGTVTSSPAGINCGADCSEPFAHGTGVTLNAIPGATNTFIRWSDPSCGTDPQCVVSMTSDRSLTATFTRDRFTLNVETAGPGAVTSAPGGIDCGSTCGAQFDYGTTVALTATPDPNAVFSGWSGACTGTDTCVVTTTSYVVATFTTPPDTQIDSGPAEGSTSSNNDPQFGFSGSPAGDVDHFECKLDADSFAACGSPKAYTDLADGSHTFSVRACDVSNNCDASAANRTFTVDTTPPDTTPPALTITQPAEGSTVNTASFEVKGIAGTAPGDQDQVTVTISANSGNVGCGPAIADPDNTTGAYSLFSCSLPDGRYTATAKQSDAAGNEGTAVINIFTIDTTAPQTGLRFEGEANAFFDGPNSHGPIADDTPSFNLTTTDPAGSFECRVDGAAFAACNSTTTLGHLNDGSHTFEARSYDLAGNRDQTPASVTFTIDTTPPDTTITSGPSNGSTSSTNTPSFVFSATPTADHFECRIDTGSFATCPSPKSYIGLADGQHTFAVRACDAAGNCDASPATRTWTVDTTPPQTQITSHPPSQVTIPKGQATITFRFAANESGVRFECKLDKGNFARCTSPFTTKVGMGAHSFSVRGTDQAGNVGPNASFSFTVSKG